MNTDQVQPTEHEELKVLVLQENVRVDKHLVDTGRGIRIHKTVAEYPCQIDERLLREGVNVEHVPVDRIVPLDQAPQTRYEGETLVIPVLEEVLVVERRLRIKEELHIIRTRREEHHAETIMLKSEQVSIEHFEDSGGNQSI